MPHGDGKTAKIDEYSDNSSWLGSPVTSRHRTHRLSDVASVYGMTQTSDKLGARPASRRTAVLRHFTGRQYSLLGRALYRTIATVKMSGCLSVCLSHAGTVSKRRMLGSRKFLIFTEDSPRTDILGVKVHLKIRKGSPQTRASKWDRENLRFFGQ